MNKIVPFFSQNIEQNSRKFSQFACLFRAFRCISLAHSHLKLFKMAELVENTIPEGFIDVSGDGGLLKKVLEKGRGPEFPNPGYEVSAHYTGTLLDGTKFDSSRDRGTPFKFTIGQGQVIKGWDVGFASMTIGEKAILRCRHDYAYGAMGSPPKIPGK